MAVRIARVLISEPVDDSCVQILKNAGIDVDHKPSIKVDQLKAELKNYDALVVRSATKVTADVIESGVQDGGALKLIGRAGTGVDNIDCKAATQHGIIVINAPGGNTLSAAELTCAMVMSLARSIPAGCASLKAGKWDRKNFMGQEVMGKTLAIVGLGRIGREVAHRMQAFGMKTIGYDPLVPGEESITFGVQSFSLEELWPQADFITLHVPLIPSTKNLVNDEVLSKCRKGVCFINCARGGVIDEDALVRALESGQCGGAGLDVFLEEPPKNRALVEHPRVICTPHLGASTVEAQRKVAEEIAEQFIQLAQGKSVPGVVNAPILQFMEQPENRSWMALSEKLGNVVGSLSPSPKHLKLVTSGKFLNGKARFLSLSAVVGAFKNPGSTLNVISAPARVSELGIKLETDHEADEEARLSLHCQNNEARDLVAVGRTEGNLSLLTELGGDVFSPPIVLRGTLALFQQFTFQGLLGCLENIKPHSVAFSVNGGWAVAHLPAGTPQPPMCTLAVLGD